MLVMVEPCLVYPESYQTVKQLPGKKVCQITKWYVYLQIFLVPAVGARVASPYRRHNSRVYLEGGQEALEKASDGIPQPRRHRVHGTLEYIRLRHINHEDAFGTAVTTFTY